MTLDYIFENYSGYEEFVRAAWNRSIAPMDLWYLRDLKKFGNLESRAQGYLVPDYLIDDANADDWELVE